MSPYPPIVESTSLLKRNYYSSSYVTFIAQLRCITNTFIQHYRSLVVKLEVAIVLDYKVCIKWRSKGLHRLSIRYFAVYLLHTLTRCHR